MTLPARTLRDHQAPAIRLDGFSGVSGDGSAVLEPAHGVLGNRLQRVSRLDGIDKVDALQDYVTLSTYDGGNARIEIGHAE